MNGVGEAADVQRSARKGRGEVSCGDRIKHAESGDVAGSAA